MALRGGFVVLGRLRVSFFGHAISPWFE